MIRLFKLLFALTLTVGCVRQSKHPQADLLNRNNPQALTEDQIITYSDSLNTVLNSLQKRSSLIYRTDNASVNVEEYSSNGSPLLYVRHTSNDTLINSTERLYLKNDTIILIHTNSSIIKNGNTKYVEQRLYLRNNIPFKSETRSAMLESEISTLSFQEDKIKLAKPSYSAVLADLNDAINGNNKYQLVFEQYISTEDGGSIQLKGKTPNSYSASVTTNTKDSFTDSLANYPELFKDHTLKFDWEVTDNEAVYVHRSSNATTSANGLKR